MVTTRSTSAAAAAAEASCRTPRAPARCRAAGTRSKPATAWPALTRLPAIGNPMLPKPMKPILAMGASPRAVCLPRGYAGLSATARARRPLVLQPVAGAKNPADQRQAEACEQHGHRQADAHVYVGDRIETPAKTADQINDRVEQAERLPGWWQQVDGIEAAAQKGERRNDQERDHLQLLEAIRPNADNEAE